MNMWKKLSLPADVPESKTHEPELLSSNGSEKKSFKAEFLDTVLLKKSRQAPSSTIPKSGSAEYTSASEKIPVLVVVRVNLVTLRRKLDIKS